VIQGLGPSGSPELVKELRRKLHSDPANRINRHNLAVELRKCGQIHEALAEIERTWNDGLHRAETATMFGHLLADTGQFDAAVTAYREAVRIKPELVEAHPALASLLPQPGPGHPALSSLAAPTNRPSLSESLFRV